MVADLADGAHFAKHNENYPDKYCKVKKFNGKIDDKTGNKIPTELLKTISDRDVNSGHSTRTRYRLLTLAESS